MIDISITLRENEGLTRAKDCQVHCISTFQWEKVLSAGGKGWGINHEIKNHDIEKDKEIYLY